jgi:hypothetical protein
MSKILLLPRSGVTVSSLSPVIRTESTPWGRWQPGIPLPTDKYVASGPPLQVREKTITLSERLSGVWIRVYKVDGSQTAAALWL